MKIRFGAILLSLASTPAARAVIIYDQALQNTTAPAGDAGWSSVGHYGDGAGVAVSPHSFLTAQHLGFTVGGTFSLGNVNYTTTATTNIAGSEMMLVQVQQTIPQNEIIPLYSQNDETSLSFGNKPISVIGYGGPKGPTNDGKFDLTGAGWYFTNPTTTKTWGMISGFYGDSTINGQEYLSYQFSPLSGVNEAGVTPGDSGGGMFIYNNGVWQLDGIVSSYNPVFTPSGSALSAAIYNTAGLNADMNLPYPTPSMLAYISRVSDRSALINKDISTLEGWIATWKNSSADNTWTTPTNWSTGASPNAAYLSVVFDDTVTGVPGLISLNGSQTVANVTFNTASNGYTIDTPGTSDVLTLQSNTGTAQMIVSGGATHTINATIALQTNLNVTLKNSATLVLSKIDNSAGQNVAIVSVGTGSLVGGNFDGAPGGPTAFSAVGTAAQLSATGSLTVGNNAQVTLARVRTATLSVVSGATLTIAESSPTYAQQPGDPAGADQFVSVIKSTALAINGTLNLTNNDLIIDYTGNPSPLTTVEALVASGYDSGDWLGPGITSSVAALNPGKFTLGILDNAQRSTPFDTFDGIDTSSHTQIIIKFTWVADLNLDGIVDTSDAITFASNFHIGNTSNYMLGGIDYSGVYDTSDAVLFASAYNANLPHLPEPASLELLAAGGAGLLLKTAAPFATLKQSTLTFQFPGVFQTK